MNGLIVVNKEKGYTSFDVVKIVSKILNIKKIGHTGTLDPFAEGVLVLCIGKCTKLCDVLINHNKRYYVEFELGYETDTLDNTGNIIKSSNKIISYDEIKKVIFSFIGEYNQIVPKYSAVKINGKKLYEYARNNIDIELPSRLVSINDIDIVSIGNIIKMYVSVSKGTYIRSLVRDIGERLGTYATVIKLVRIDLGNFNIKDSYKIEDIKNNNYKLISVEDIFKDYSKVTCDNDLYNKINNGVELDNIYNSDYVLFYYNNRLISIYKDNKKNKIRMFIHF